MGEISDERIEVAAKLRGPFDVCECVGHTYINGTLYGMQVCARDELALRNGMRHLADLIDPTCEVDSIEPVEDELGQTVGYELHLTCGHAPEQPYIEAPAYCDECGARVVSGDAN